MSNNNQKVLLVLIVAIMFLGFLFYGIEKIKDSVIKDLKRNYAPGPYDPGFDPDKVDTRGIADPSLVMEDNLLNLTLNHGEQWAKMWDASR